MAFDPSNASVDEVLRKLEKASDTERQAILRAEQGGKARKTVLEPYGIDADARTDAAGRTLYPWEVDPENHVYHVQVEESAEELAHRKLQQERDELIAAATAAQGGDQGGATAPGSGTPAAADTGTAGGDAATV